MLNTEKEEQIRNIVLKLAQAPCPYCDIILFFANHFRRIEMSHDQAKDSLNDLLQNDIPKHLVPGGTVSFENLGRGMQAMLREDIIGVEYVEEKRDHPVSDDGCYELKDDIGHARYDRRSKGKGVFRERWKLGREGNINRHR